MEQNEFLKKFLPNWEAKIEEYRNREFYDNPMCWEAWGEDQFLLNNFLEALQNFTDKICEKQREECLSRLVDYIINSKEECSITDGMRGAILNTKSIEISEL